VPAEAQLRGAPDSFAPLVRQVMPAVVNIAAVQEVAASGPRGRAQDPALDEMFRRFGRPQRPPATRKATALGSGFIIDPTGYVVTNNHVVGQANEIFVIMQNGRELRARLVGRDEQTDLALLKVDADQPLPFVRWGDSDRVEVGDWVLAVGNPFGLGGSVTAGIISARGRDIHAGPYDDFLQLDAPINQGNSGGPSFNMDGQVIGVNTAIFSPTGGSVGIGFAIPSSFARQIIDQLRGQGRIVRGWIGVSIRDLTPELSNQLGLRPEIDGVLIDDIASNGPAARAGLAKGDVIVGVDGRRVEQVKDVPRAIAAIAPGTQVRLTVYRRGSEISIPVVIGQSPGR
jgi:serine protease Do